MQKSWRIGVPVPGLGGAGIVSREEAKRTARSGWTALILACEKGHIEAARLLVDKGADVNVQNLSAWTCVCLVTP